MNATLPEEDASTPDSESADSSASLSTDLLLKAMDEAKRNEARLKKQIEEMQRRLANTQEEGKILTELIALRSGNTPDEPVNETVQIPPTPRINTIDFAKSGQNALAAVVAILKEANRPVHISDLMRRLGEASVQIPGAGTQANLISHLRRDKRIVRPSRGMYALADWGLSEMPGQAKRRRRRRRKK